MVNKEKFTVSNFISLHCTHCDKRQIIVDEEIGKLYSCEVDGAPEIFKQTKKCYSAVVFGMSGIMSRSDFERKDS